MSLHANPERVMPKVPGINAQPLQPSIGCDHWRTHKGSKPRRNASIRKARPMARVASPELMPGNQKHRNTPPRDNSGGKANRSPKARKATVKRTYSHYGAVSLRSGITL